ITPVNNNKAFSSPPSSDALINFVNELGYPKLVRNLSNVFTKLIIYHLQRKHKFHPRPDSSLHLPNEEPVLGYLKFNTKGTKREVFGMPIPGSDPDSPAPKPTKTTKKSKPSTPKAALRPPVLKLASSQQPEPKPALAKSQEKKRIPEKEPRVDDEEAEVQRVLEESLKSIYNVPQGPLPPLVIREPESRKYQPLLETPKKKSPTDQYIFQRRTSTPTGSSGHDESLSLYVELGLTNSEVDFDEDIPGIDAGVQGDGLARPNPDDQDEGQARPNPDEQAEGQAGPNPYDAEASQPLPSLIVHAGSDLEHIDLDVVNVST
nr:hypothetical protein [Tanacetum cinerariifolium]